MRIPEQISKPIWLPIVITFSTLLAACGGSTDPDLPEGDDYSDSALQVSMVPSGGRIIFQWNPVADTTFYRVYLDADGDTEARVLADAVPLTNEIITDKFVFVYTPGAAAIDWNSANFLLDRCVAGEDEPICEPITLTDAFAARGGRPLFQWLPVEGATHYRLSVSSDGISAYEQLGNDIPADQPFFVYDIDTLNFNWTDARFQLESCITDVCEVLGNQSLQGASVFSVAAIGPPSFVAHPVFGSSLALSDDGDTLVVGASGTSEFDCEEITGYTLAQLDFIATLTPEELASTNFNAQCSYVIPDNPEGDPDNPDDDFVPPETLVESISQAGAVYVYTRDDLAWQGVVRLEAPNGEANDGMGRSVALSADGMTLAVGAPLESSASLGVGGNQDDTDNEALFSGAVYIYTRVGDEWVLQEYIKATNTNEQDLFGWEVALSGDGNLLAVGAVLEAGSGIDGDLTNNDTERAGAVYTYTRTDGVWTPQDYLKASDVDAHDLFGISLAMSDDGDYLAVGAIEEGEPPPPGQQDGRFRVCNPISGSDSGSVYVFHRELDAWTESAALKASNASRDDCFGFSVSLNADATRLAVGAPLEDNLGTGVNNFQSKQKNANTGAAYLYERVGGQWAETDYFKASNTGIPDLFGAAVKLNNSGDVLVVGAVGESSPAFGINGSQIFNTMPGSGAAYAFGLKNNNWKQVAYIKASISRPSINFGWKIDIAGDGEALAVSAPGWEAAGYSGSVFLY